MTKRLLARGVSEGKLAADIDPLRLYVSSQLARQQDRGICPL
jgi:hypothetical protein